MRANSVPELTRKPVDGSHTEERGEEKRNPPGVSTGGSQMRVNAGAGDATGADFASAFLAMIQARLLVNEVVDLSDRIHEAHVQDKPSPLTPEGRKRDISIFSEAFEIYRSSWPRKVRLRFKDLTGQHFEDFETSLEALGEALYDGIERPGPVVTMITPATFAGELAE